MSDDSNAIRGKTEEVQVNQDKLRIYQLFHDEPSYHNVSNSPFIVPLCLDKDFHAPNKGIATIGHIQYNTNQLAESRAFYYALKNLDNLDYISFTSHRHNHKYPTCIRVQDIDLNLVNKCFLDKKVRVISFHNRYGLIDNTRHHPGMTKFLLQYVNEELGLNYWNRLKLRLGCQYSNVPFSNSFIMKTEEFKKYFLFIDNFITYLDSHYDIRKPPQELGIRDYRKSRGWGYVCERILPYYLLYHYGPTFRLVFLDKEKNIHIYNKQPISNLYWKYMKTTFLKLKHWGRLSV